MSWPASGADVFLKALPCIAEEHAMALMRDSVEEDDSVRDANWLVNKTIAEGMRLLRDGVSEADRAVVVDAHRAGTLRVIVVACDDVGDLGQRLRRCRRAGDGARAIGCLPAEQMKEGGWARGVVEIDVERGAPTTSLGYWGTTACRDPPRQRRGGQLSSQTSSSARSRRVELLTTSTTNHRRTTTICVIFP